MRGELGKRESGDGGSGAMELPVQRVERDGGLEEVLRHRR